MIKAIETKYKGYRFRSRLEARWAVFFDALGLDWEYEPEGYEFKNGTRYLPDFLIKKQYFMTRDLYIEVKPDKKYEPFMRLNHVYMAGKIASSPNDCMADHWRESVADDYYLGEKYEFHSAFNDLSEVRLFRNGYAYSGPHFSCNHGTYVEHKRALNQIVSSDIVFAWISSNDAFGTFAEIGFAHAKKIPIYIGFHNSVSHNDMWFLAEMANNHGVYDSARSAFDELMPDRISSCSDEEKASSLSIMLRSHADVLLVCGDPLESNKYLYRYGAVFNFNFARSIGINDIDKIKHAAIKARSARFEHGESPL